MAKQYKVGDVVKLRSGSPCMRIIGFVDHQYHFNHALPYSGRAAVVQWKSKGCVETSVFAECMLEDFYDFCLN